MLLIWNTRQIGALVDQLSITFLTLHLHFIKFPKRSIFVNFRLNGGGKRIHQSQYPLDFGQQRLVGGQGARVVPRLAQLVSDLVPGDQGMGVVGAQHPQPGGQDVAVFGFGAGVVRAPP